MREKKASPFAAWASLNTDEYDAPQAINLRIQRYLDGEWCLSMELGKLCVNGLSEPSFVRAVENLLDSCEAFFTYEGREPEHEILGLYLMLRELLKELKQDD